MPTNRVRDELYHTLSLLAYKDVKANDLTVKYEDGKQTWKVTGKETFLLNDEDIGFNAGIYKITELTR